MAIKVFSGCDIEGTGSGNANNAGRWRADGGTFSATAGRYGGGGQLINSSSQNAIMIGDAPSTLIVGQALYIPSTRNGIIKFTSGATVAATLTIAGASGLFSFHRGDAATLVGSATDAGFTVNTWMWVSCKIVWHTSAGSVLVKRGSDTVLNLSGVDTLGAASIPDRVGYSTNAVNTNMVVDDVVVCDTTGPAPFNDILADLRVHTLRPSSDVGTQQWTRSTGATNYALVDDPNLLTTDYVSSDVVGNVDRYGISNLPAGVVPAAVQATLSGNATVGTHDVRLGVHVDADTTLSTMSFTSSSPSYKSAILDTAPGGGAWNASKVNALELSIEQMT